MQVRSALILSALLLLSGVGYYVSVHGGNIVEDGPVTQALSAELENVRVKSVDFSKLAGFPFTEMQVFEPFTNRNDICRAVDLTGWDCLRKVPFQVEDGHYFLVFRQQTEVVHHEFMSVSHGRFVAVNNGFRTTDAMSKFMVVRNWSAKDAEGHPQVYMRPERMGVLSNVAQ